MLATRRESEKRVGIREAWAQIWQRFDGTASAPWRSLHIEQELPWAAALPELTAAVLQEASKSDNGIGGSVKPEARPTQM